jgi:hypothetical protein
LVVLDPDAGWEPLGVKLSDDARTMVRADLENENETIARAAGRDARGP